MMAFPIVLVLAGLVLLISASPKTGGLAKIKSGDTEATLPQITGPVRIIALVLGSVLIMAGVLLGIEVFVHTYDVPIPTPAAATSAPVISATHTPVPPIPTPVSSPTLAALGTPPPTSTSANPPTPTPTVKCPAPQLPPSGRIFNLYTDAEAKDNHYFPTGKMGDIDDIEEINDASKDQPHSGTTAIKVVYQAQGAGQHYCPAGTEVANVCRWAGLYWQDPANNWGTACQAGYNLTGFQKLTFWARADPASPNVVVEFQVGGIGSGIGLPPPFPDSQLQPQTSGWQTLSEQWKPYEIDLRNSNLSFVIGGFAWIVKWDNNEITLGQPKTIVFYLDDIRFER
jgi:hypothetical protein